MRKSQRALYDLFVEAEKNTREVSRDDILTATKWKGQTIDTYLAKGQLSDYLAEVRPGIFEVSKVSHLTAEEFARRFSQSKHRRGLGHNFKSRLAKALVRKSKDNMMLALELYNRPSLENRLDGFVLLFCTSWEQLLKAELIERDGKESIYRKSSRQTKIRETVSLRKCLERIFPANDKRRKNLERITDFRDQAVHLLMPETQGVLSRLFQAGALNYVEKFEDLTEQRFLELNATGLLTLVGELRTPTVAMLKSAYGEIGKEIFDLIKTTQDEIMQESDWRFAVPIDVKVVFARKGQGDELKLVANTDEGLEGLRRAIIVNKPVDHNRTHPYKASDLITEINRKLEEMYDVQKLEQILPARDKKTGKPAFNSYCLQAILFKLKWRKANNEFHYASTNPVYHKYSDQAVTIIIKKITSHPQYLSKARSDYSESRRRR
ncbi:FIG00645011: hypothetical protein [hydrothermal vent metagenome]|uniref:Uncharacterized protein n=1 Tax=hydrothermal vent metagenome TaxID=652676 RepID=A0A3B0VDX2_9ZZZZ